MGTQMLKFASKGVSSLRGPRIQNKVPVDENEPLKKWSEKKVDGPRVGRMKKKN